MSALDTLRKARALLAEPGKWTQLVLARNEYGEEIDVDSGEGVAFCALGAVWHVDRANGDEAAELLNAPAFEARNGYVHDPDGGERGPSQTDVERYNDAPGRTVEDVLALFDRAIWRAEGAS